MSANNEGMNRLMNMAQTITLKDVLQYKSKDVNDMITAMSSL